MKILIENNSKIVVLFGDIKIKKNNFVKDGIIYPYEIDKYSIINVDKYPKYIVNFAYSYNNSVYTVENQKLIDNFIKVLLEENKKSKIAELEKLYQFSLYEDIEYMGTIFKGDKYTQDTLVKVLSAGSVPDGFFWRDIYNNNIPMTYAEVQGFSGVLLIRGQTNFVKLQDLKQQVRDATTLEEIENITWS